MPKININGITREMTVEEIAEMERMAAETTPRLSYDEAVDAEIRKRYSVSQEFAILRQKDEKPDEYAEYYAYCEECKENIKNKFGI